MENHHSYSDYYILWSIIFYATFSSRSDLKSLYLTPIRNLRWRKEAVLEFIQTLIRKGFMLLPINDKPFGPFDYIFLYRKDLYLELSALRHDFYMAKLGHPYMKPSINRYRIKTSTV